MGIRSARTAGGIAPNNPSNNPTPQPASTATLSIRSENAPMVNRTAAPLTARIATIAAHNEAPPAKSDQTRSEQTPTTTEEAELVPFMPKGFLTGLKI